MQYINQLYNHAMNPQNDNDDINFSWNKPAKNIPVGCSTPKKQKSTQQWNIWEVPQYSPVPL